MPPRPYRLAFYLDARGDSPVERWLQELDPVAAYALGSAMDGLLQQSGPLLCVLRPPVRELTGRRFVRVPVPGPDRGPAPATRKEGSPEPARVPAEGSVPRLLPSPRRQRS